MHKCIQQIKHWSGCDNSIPFLFQTRNLIFRKTRSFYSLGKWLFFTLILDWYKQYFQEGNKGFRCFPCLQSAPQFSYYLYFFLLPLCIGDFPSLLLVGCAVPAAVRDSVAGAGAGPLSSLVPSCPFGLCVAMAKDVRDVTHQISIEKQQLIVLMDGCFIYKRLQCIRLNGKINFRRGKRLEKLEFSRVAGESVVRCSHLNCFSDSPM